MEAASRARDTDLDQISCVNTIRIAIEARSRSFPIIHSRIRAEREPGDTPRTTAGIFHAGFGSPPVGLESDAAGVIGIALMEDREDSEAIDRSK
jgi:hypothetical protein